MTTIYTLNISDGFVKNNIELYKLLPHNRLKKTALMPKIKHLTSLWGEIIVRTVAKSELNIKNSEIIIERESSGKPFLRGFPNFNFNISHSNNIVTVAFSDFSVGIDIEKLSPHNPKVAERYFHLDEKEYINKHINKNLAFYEIWTAKEAYLKQKGRGISADFSNFSVTDLNISKSIKTFENNGFVISVCCDSPKDIEFKSFSTID